MKLHEEKGYFIVNLGHILDGASYSIPVNSPRYLSVCPLTFVNNPRDTDHLQWIFEQLE